MKTYNLYDCILDIAKAWDTIEVTQLYHSFDKIIDKDLFLQIKADLGFQYIWPGNEFTGFSDDEGVVAARTRNRLQAISDASAAPSTDDLLLLLF